jgi:hypothetical protein
MTTAAAIRTNYIFVDYENWCSIRLALCAAREFRG